MSMITLQQADQGLLMTSVCDKTLQLILDKCKDLGFLNSDKFVPPSPVLEFPSIIPDTQKREIRISKQRLKEVMDELLQWYQHHFATKREMLSFVGS